MPATTQFPKLERFSLWCRWAIALITAVGGVAFAIWAGSLEAHDGSWAGVMVGVVLAFSCLLGGLSYIWKRALALPAMYLLSLLATIWLAVLTRQKWIENAHVNNGTLLIAAGLAGISILYIVGFHKVRGKNPPPRLSFWWWLGPKG
jgi:hypothetical protein